MRSGLHFHVRRIYIYFFLPAVALCIPKHYFLRQPYDTEVRVGGIATLRCAIQHKRTAVQWSMNDFALGEEFDDPRYRFQGDQSKGEYNLEISNVQVEDDGDYNCQAGAAPGLPPLISREAHLNVLAPPNEVVLDPVSMGRINVKYPGSVEITCSVPDTKPESEISWHINGQAYSGSISRKTSAGSKSKLMNTYSSIILTPNKLENGSEVECIVNQAALDEPISKRATLNILYPPNPPRISGLSSQPMRVGVQFEATCISTGGNPIANITWTIGDEPLVGYKKLLGNGTKSILRYAPRPNDNLKFLTCKVNSPALDQPLEDKQKLKVNYPPERIIIERDPAEGTQESGKMTFTCSHTDSNPAATLEWYIGSEKLPDHWTSDSRFIPYTITSSESADLGSRTSLILKTVTRQDVNLSIKCKARITEIGYNGEASARPKVNYPPREVTVSTENPLNSPLVIEGANGNSEIAYQVGDTIMIHCQAKGGDPAPAMAWFVEGSDGGRKEIPLLRAPKVTVQTDKNAEDSILGEYITSSTLELTLKPSHNSAVVSCETSHHGYHDKVSGRTTLRSLSVVQFPSSLVAGKPMSLTCITTPSYPAAEIFWFKNEKIIDSRSIIELPLSQGDNRGYISQSRLRLTPEASDDGAVFFCKANVQILQESVKQQYTVSIEYSPKFVQLMGNRSAYNATEGADNIEIRTEVRSNPRSVVYKWFRYVPSKEITKTSSALDKVLLTKNRRIFWDSNSGVLHMNDLKRTDNGLYAVRATNSRGSSEENITINVFYPPEVSKVTGPSTLLNEGDSTVLRCYFRSHAMTPAHVTWIKEMPGVGRSKYDSKTYADHSALSLSNMTAADRGAYKCIVDNSIGDTDSGFLNISLSFAPIFAKSTTQKVAVTSVGKNGLLFPAASLRCVVRSFPKSIIRWMKGNHTISTSGDKRYFIVHKDIDSETTSSTLLVRKISKEDVEENTGKDLTHFACIASNAQGQQSQDIKVLRHGPPDAPSDLFAYNISHSSVHLEWKEGFDGGSKQKFVVQYVEFSNAAFSAQFKELTSHANSLAVNDLNADRDYLFRVIATNSQEKSLPSSSIKIRTKPSIVQSSPNESKGAFGTYVIMFGVIASVVFVVIISASVVVYRKCKVTKQSYRPNVTETDCEVLHGESSLSSPGSTAKKHECEKLVNNNGKSDSQTVTDCGKHLLSDDAEIPLNCDYDEPWPFEISTSRCSSRHSAGDEGCCRNGGYKFSSFKGNPTTNDPPRVGRFDFSSKSARFNRQNEPPTLQRNCSEPRFRCDMVPTDERLATLEDKVGENYSDVQLPPALTPYVDDRPYATRRKVGSISDLPSERFRSKRLLLDDDGDNHYQGKLRLYQTLDRIKSNYDRNDDACTDMENRTNDKKLLTASFHEQPNTCLYNLVSASPDNYAMTVLHRPREHLNNYLDRPRGHESHCTSTTNNSGLSVKSMDNMPDLCSESFPQQRASIVNEDGTINTYGFDLPPPPLDIIREAHSQDVLPDDCLYSYQDLPIPGRSEFLPDTSAEAEDVEINRKSLLKGSQSTSIRRETTPTVRFRDELVRALDSHKPTDFQMSDQQAAEQNGFDDDADSGCGGSADVQVHCDRSPVSTTGRHGVFPMLTNTSDGKGMELRV